MLLILAPLFVVDFQQMAFATVERPHGVIYIAVCCNQGWPEEHGSRDILACHAFFPPQILAGFFNFIDF